MEWKDKRAEEYRKLLERARSGIELIMDDIQYGYGAEAATREMLEILWRDIRNALKES